MDAVDHSRSAGNGFTGRPKGVGRDQVRVDGLYALEQNVYQARIGYAFFQQLEYAVDEVLGDRIAYRFKVSG